MYTGTKFLSDLTCACKQCLGNFAKATFFCLKALYGYLEPTMWKETKFAKSPFQEFTDDLTDKKVIKSAGKRSH